MNHTMTLGKSRIALVPFLGAFFSHEKKFAIKPQYFRIRRQKRCMYKVRAC